MTNLKKILHMPAMDSSVNTHESVLELLIDERISIAFSVVLALHEHPVEFEISFLQRNISPHNIGVLPSVIHSSVILLKNEATLSCDV